MSMRLFVLLLVFANFLSVNPSFAQKKCVKGKPCGNSCIAKNKTCRVDAEERKETTFEGVTRGQDYSVESFPSGLSLVQDPCIVERVVDGDTLHCDNGWKVRLLLIDAPELRQGPFGESSKNALAELAPVGGEVFLWLDVEEYDRYDRILAHVQSPSGLLLNEEMLRQGMAVVSVYPPNIRLVDRYRSVVDVAQALGIGLWTVDGFDCLPSAFRSGKCR